MLHAVITLFFVLAGGLFATSLPGWLCAAFFVGREFAQAEYRWIEAYGHGKRDNMPWWGGFDSRAWNLKSLLDWLLPVCVATLGGAI